MIRIGPWHFGHCGTAGWSEVAGCRFWRLMQQNAAELKQWSTFSVGQPSEVSNPRETLGQHMLQESAEELCRQ